MIRQCKHDLPGLGSVVEYVVIDVETLLAKRHCELIFDEPCVEVLLNDSEPVFGVSEVEEG